MKRLPGLKAKDVIRALRALGFEEDRQRGGHLVLVNRATKRRTVIPIHGGKDIKKTLIKKIVEEDAGVSTEEFLRAL
jgi:predicted RNA binding protein YcfA (HicA-like mRNA interferase family)